MHSIGDSRHPWIFGTLLLAVAATRFHHEGGVFALPDASLAAFFLAGRWLAGGMAFWVLLAAAGAVDWLAVNAMGVSDFCLSPAYVFLVPTYAAMWWGGRLSGARWQGIEPRSLLGAGFSLLLSCAAAFVISDSSFQLLSGKTAAISFAQFLAQSVEHFPTYAAATGIYVFCALPLPHVLSVFRRGKLGASVAP